MVILQKNIYTNHPYLVHIMQTEQNQFLMLQNFNKFVILTLNFPLYATIRPGLNEYCNNKQRMFENDSWGPSDKILNQKKTKWRDTYGLRIQPYRVKIMHEKSVLIPPPFSIQRRKKQIFKNSVSNSKFKFEKIFKQIEAQNQNIIKCSIYFGNQKGQYHYLTTKECQQFLNHFRKQGQQEFKALSRTSESFMKDGLYDGMQLVLTQLSDWIRTFQSDLLRKYKERAEAYSKIRDIKKKYQSCGALCQAPQTSEPQTSFSMKQMEQQINKLMQKQSIGIVKAADSNKHSKKQVKKNDDGQESDSDSRSIGSSSSSDSISQVDRDEQIDY